jgi:sarcosine oxidase subunit gamma
MQKERDTLSNMELNLRQFTPVMQSPLHHFNLAEQAVPIDASQGVWANEIALQGYISLRGNAQNAAFTKAAKKALDVALPTLPCGLIDTPLLRIYWLSPDEWLIVCERKKCAELHHALQAALVLVHSQIVDNSGAYTSVLLQGKNATDILQHCTVYNLHALETDKVVGTTFGKSSLILHRHENGYMLIFRRSFADYIWRYLERAATPYGFGISKL